MASVTKSEKDWEAESACDTLMRAEEIKRKPELHKKALAVMEKRQKDMEMAMGDADKLINMSVGMKTRMKRRHMI